MKKTLFLSYTCGVPGIASRGHVVSKGHDLCGMDGHYHSANGRSHLAAN